MIETITSKERKKFEIIIFAKIISQSRFYLASIRFMNSFFFFFLLKSLRNSGVQQLSPRRGRVADRPANVVLNTKPNRA